MSVKQRELSFSDAVRKALRDEVKEAHGPFRWEDILKTVLHIDEFIEDETELFQYQRSGTSSVSEAAREGLLRVDRDGMLYPVERFS